MKVKYIDQKKFDSGLDVSVLEVAGDQFYFLSSDGKEILTTNDKWVSGDRFLIKDAGDGGILHPSATVQVRDGKSSALLLLNSGSDEPGRSALKINLKSRASEQINLGEFYARLTEAGIEDIKINSATIINDKVVLSNVGNADEPSGILIVTDVDFWKKQKSADISISRLQWEKQTNNSVEVTSIFYAYQNDLLLIAGHSASDRELTEPGTFLAVVENAYRKIDRKRIKVNEYFELAQTSENFTYSVVKAMGALDEKGKKIKIHLTAIGKDEESSLIKLRLKAN